MAKRRFIVAEPEVCESLGVPFIIMLSDMWFWNDNYDALKDWCKHHRGQVMGMTVEIYDEPTLTAFTLKWS